MSAATAIEEKKSGLNETDKLLIRVGAYTLGSVLLSGTLFWIGRKIYRDRKQKSSAEKILTDNTPQNYAERFNKALNDSWFGADIGQVRGLFTEIPSQQAFADTVSAYKDVTDGKKELHLDLAQKLSSDEYYEMQNILSAKPAKTGQKAIFDVNAAMAMTKRIKTTFDYDLVGLSTSDASRALQQALYEIPSLYGFAMVKIIYKKYYHANIEDDLDAHLGVFSFSWKDIIYTKPVK